MLIYLLLSSIGVVACWLYFHLFLRNTTFFRLNRLYLLAAIIFCLSFPLLGKMITQQEVTSLIDNPIIADNQYKDAVVNVVEEIRGGIQAVGASTPDYWSWLFLIYSVIVFILLGRSVYAFIGVKRISQGKMSSLDGLKVVQSGRVNQPFSFFKTIYLPVNEEVKIPSAIFQHEKEHIIQHHFVDILLAEVLSILLWFNPVVYLLKNSIRLNLEYLADRAVIKNGVNKIEYQSLLLSYALKDNLNNPLTTNFTLPLKNRINMMQKQRSNSWRRWTIIGILPLAILLTSMSTQDQLQTQIVKNIGPINFLFVEQDVPNISPIKESDITKISAHFGESDDPFSGLKKLHTGIDLVAKNGTPVYPTADGEVVISENDDAWGNHIKIKHSEVYSTRYGHLNSLVVKAGAIVQQGDLIGYVGSTGSSTGPHLHYEVHVNGVAVDPAQYFDAC